MTRSSCVETHASRFYPRRVLETHMGGSTTDDVRQVCRPGRHLKGKRLPIHDIVMEGRRYPRPFHSPLIQCAMNVKEVSHSPWHPKVHVEELPNQVF